MYGSNLTYRSDIDGLRAISVLAVIAFHLNGMLPGGYVGVDIFFVISGYLIGKIIFDEIEARTFSFAHFYERRARRILPALVTTLLITSGAAFAMLAPSEIAGFVKSAIASLFSAANIYFYATSGYFAPSAVDLPLLHIWSLGIEEQFYIVFPLIVVLLSRYAPRALVSVLFAIAGFSVVSSQLALFAHPEAAFYLPQNRAFELAIGVLLVTVNFSPERFSQGVGACGALLLAVAFTLFNEKTPFPGVAALVPCVGTAAIIWSGGYGTVFSKALSAKPLVYLGKISYPLYLWHWPAIVFGRIALPHAPASLFAFLVVGASLGAAMATHHLIERPVRYGPTTRFAGFAATSCISLLIVSTALIGLSARRPTILFQPPNLTELYLQGTCFLNADQDRTGFILEKCLPEKRPQALLWGDSHAAHFYSGLQEELAGAGYSLGMLAAGACTPIIDRPVQGRPFCKEINDFVLSSVRSKKPDIVILSAFWKPFVIEELERTLRILNQIPGVSVVVIGNTPVFEESVPVYLERGTQAAIKISDRSAAERLMHERLVKNQIENVQYLSLKDITCPRGHCLLFNGGGVPYYFDEGHLTREGSLWIASRIVPDIIAFRRQAEAKPSNTVAR